MSEALILLTYLVVFTVAITFSVKRKTTTYKRDYQGRFSQAKKEIKWIGRDY